MLSAIPHNTLDGVQAAGETQTTISMTELGESGWNARVCSRPVRSDNSALVREWVAATSFGPAGLPVEDKVASRAAL